MPFLQCYLVVGFIAEQYVHKKVCYIFPMNSSAHAAVFCEDPSASCRLCFQPSWPDDGKLHVPSYALRPSNVSLHSSFEQNCVCQNIVLPDCPAGPCNGECEQTCASAYSIDACGKALDNPKALKLCPKNATRAAVMRKCCLHVTLQCVPVYVCINPMIKFVTEMRFSP